MNPLSDWAAIFRCQAFSSSSKNSPPFPDFPLFYSRLFVLCHRISRTQVFDHFFSARLFAIFRLPFAIQPTHSLIPFLLFHSSSLAAKIRLSIRDDWTFQSNSLGFSSLYYLYGHKQAESIRLTLQARAPGPSLKFLKNKKTSPNLVDSDWSGNQ